MLYSSIENCDKKRLLKDDVMKLKLYSQKSQYYNLDYPMMQYYILF